MTNLITISTENFCETRKAKIDNHIYTVRRMGAGDTLDISQISGEISKLQAEALNLQAKIEKSKGEEQKKYLDQSIEFVTRLNEALTRMEEAYARLFDDNEDGSKSKELIHRIGAQNVPKLLDQIFGAE